MSKHSIINKISSRNVLDIIFSYAMEDNIEFKLFIHSKFFQKKFNLDYKQFLINELDLNFDEYLICNEKNPNKKLERILSIHKINIDQFQKFCENHYIIEFKNEEQIIFKEKREKLIDIYSPFFEILSKSIIFDNFFIRIPIYEIEREKAKNDYISFFEKLNKSNSKYSAIYFNFIEDKDINYLKEFKIKYSQIKRIIINARIKDNLFLFKELFSLDINNLTYLKLEIKKENKIKPDSFEGINKLYLLEELNLKEFSFEENFILKLYNLKTLYLLKCQNISLDDKTCLNLKNLVSHECSFNKSNSNYKFPELKLLNIDRNKDLNIDFPSLNKNLKFLKSNIIFFLDLQNPSLEQIELSQDSKEIEKKMLEKIILMNSLKKISLKIRNITSKELSNIKGENIFVTNLLINWLNLNNLFELKYLQKIFPNLSIFTFEIWNDKNSNYGCILNIEENSKCKVTEFSIIIKTFQNIKFYCSPYETLTKVDFGLYCKIKNIKDIFPIFQDKSKVEFKSLIHFSFSSVDIESDIDIITNIYNNLETMPKLKYFKLYSVGMDIDIDEEFHTKFIIKLLKMKIEYINFEIVKTSNGKDRPSIYSKKELEKIYPNLGPYNPKKIQIRKIQKIYKIYPKRK